MIQQQPAHFYPIPGTEGIAEAPAYTFFDLPLSDEVLESEFDTSQAIRPEYNYSGHPPTVHYPPAFYEAHHVAMETVEQNAKIQETAQKIENATRIVTTLLLTGMAALLLFVFVDISGVNELNEFISNQPVPGK